MKHRQKVFDVVLIGSNPGGLVAGARLAGENRRVLLLKEKKYKLSYQREGYRFVPFSNFSDHLVKPSLLRKISYTPGPAKDLEQEDQPVRRVSFQVILPALRIDLYRDRSLLRRELKREFPGELMQIETFSSELDRIRQILKKIKNRNPGPPFFPLDSRSLIRRWFSFDFLSGERADPCLSPLSPEFKKFIQLRMIAQGYLLSDSYPISLIAYLLGDGEEDETGERVDPEKMTRDLLESFLQSGGRVEEVEGVEKVEVRWRDGFTLSLRGEEKVYRSRSLVLNGPLHPFITHFGRQGKALSKAGEKIRPRYALVPFFLGIDGEVVPVGMKDLLVSLFDLQKPLERGNLLFLKLSGKGDESQAPEGKRALTVGCLMPIEEGEKESGFDLQSGVMSHLNHLFPFLENHLDFIDRSWAEDQMACWSFPHFFYEADSDFRWRRGIVPIRISRNLYGSGRAHFPYLGLEGELLSGLMVGEEIARRFRS